MIIWVNGPFGGGKTTVARILTNRLLDSVLFDTERVGELIAPSLRDSHPVDDFQDWKPWRTLSVAAIVELATYLDSDIVVPQTVIVREYWSDLLAGLRASGHDVRLFTLDVESGEHERRIAGDTIEAQAAEWRRVRAAEFVDARSWLRETSTVIDTTGLSPDQVAEVILDSVRV